MDELLQGKKRLHFFQNEKVVNDAITSFEAVFPGENLYAILSKDGVAPLVKAQPNTLFLSYKSKGLSWLLHNINCFSEVICHSLWPGLDRIILRLNHPNITWVIWGADLFEGVLYKNGYKLYFDENQLFRVRAQHIPVPIYRLLVGIRDSINYKRHICAIKKINSICATVPKDIDLFTSFVNIKKSFNRKELFYYPIERLLDDQTLHSFVHGADIWINNAAGYNGNHIEVFNLIRDFKRKGMVHVPLSYGIKKYAQFVEKEGRRILGDSFDPIKVFIPREEYYNMFLSTNAFIFGHLRGCATGNVAIALYLGAKVFLFKNNVLYGFFKEKGVVLFSIEDDLNEDNINTPLPQVLRERNRDIVQRLFSYERLLSVIKHNFD